MTPQFVDLSDRRDWRVVIDAEDGVYLGQPDTVLLDDETTILVAHPLGHGGPDTVLRRSADGGRTWSERMPVPDSFTGKHNAPSIHRVVDRAGLERLVLFVSYPAMKASVSEDLGRTWSPLAPIFGDDMANTPGYKGHAPPKSVVPVSGGQSYLAAYHDHYDEDGESLVEIMLIRSSDGGLTWSSPQRASRHPSYPGAHPCEPCLVRSPDGAHLLCLARENARRYNSLWMLSDDEGATWTEMKELSWSLTGDRHIARYAHDGRLLITFRDMARGSDTYGDFVAWVGTYEDILAGRPGQYRVRLLANHGRPGDTGYAGLELLPDGTFVSTTYCVLEPETQPVIVSLRFKLSDVDAAAATGS